MYDYREAIKNDIKAFLKETIGEYNDMAKDELYDKLYEDMWLEDSVTGNGSGSYTFSTAKAKEYATDGDNIKIAVEMAKEFDSGDTLLDKVGDDDWEWVDVSVRCYLLGDCINSVLKEVFTEETPSDIYNAYFGVISNLDRCTESNGDINAEILIEELQKRTTACLLDNGNIYYMAF